jgi:ferrous iron transport protein A
VSAGAQSRCVSLAALPRGVPARVCRHDASHLPKRLEDLGFVPGTQVEVLRAAPLGDPIELELRGYRLCLRRVDLARLCVTPLSDTGV